VPPGGGTTQVCNGKYGNNGWLGLASISITGGTHITQGDVHHAIAWRISFVVQQLAS
jgi:hypothetical protein